MRKAVLTLGIVLGLLIGSGMSACIETREDNPFDAAALFGIYTNLTAYILANQCYYDNDGTPSDSKCVWGF